jgi:hypothetical protein
MELAELGGLHRDSRGQREQFNAWQGERLVQPFGARALRRYGEIVTTGRAVGPYGATAI